MNRTNEQTTKEKAENETWSPMNDKQLKLKRPMTGTRSDMRRRLVTKASGEILFKKWGRPKVTRLKLEKPRDKIQRDFKPNKTTTVL